MASLRNLVIALVLLLGSSLNAFAYEVVDVCATYMNTNKKYAVEAQLYRGEELNQRTQTNNYDDLYDYAVIFWGPGKATVIKLDNSNMFGLAPPSIGLLGSTGRDQRGYPWRLTERTPGVLDVFCTTM